jgi:hypothetical protein
VGSGLILLVIVGAWLAVLVPMALRSHDSTSSLSSVDRFNDAMRVLSRRDATARRREHRSDAPPPAARTERIARRGGGGRTDRTDRTHRPQRTKRSGRSRVSAAQRRRRVLTLLVLLAAGSLAGGLAGPTWLLGVSAGFAVLAVAYLTSLRRQAARRQREQREQRDAAARRARRRAVAPGRAARPAARIAAGSAVRIAGIPDRLPSRPLPAPLAGDAVQPTAASAGRYEGPAPVPAAIGSAWQPVPVPVPTYVSAPMAPPGPARVADARYSEALREAEQRIGILDDGPELDDILDRRRAVGG